MSVHDAEPGDIYADEQGKLWRIIGVCRDPSVTAEEVEGTIYDPNAPAAPHAAQGVAHAMIGGFQFMSRASINKRRVNGGMGGLMWNGWKRIWRNDWKAKQPSMAAADPASETPSLTGDPRCPTTTSAT